MADAPVPSRATSGSLPGREEWQGGGKAGEEMLCLLSACTCASPLLWQEMVRRCLYLCHQVLSRWIVGLGVTRQGELGGGDVLRTLEERWVSGWV